MGVNIQRCACLCMTQQAGNRSYIHALRNQQAGIGVAQAMHIQIQRQVVCFQNQLEAIGKYAPRFSWGVFLTPYCLSPAPQAEPQAAGFSAGLSAAPQAEPQAAGLSAAPQAVAGAEAAFLFQPKRSERAMVVYLPIIFSGRFALLCLYCT